MYNKYLAELSKEQLLDLIELYAKNWLAHDGVWFQSIERKFGMAEAMYHDEEAWKRFTVIEAKRIKESQAAGESRLRGTGAGVALSLLRQSERA